MAQLDCKLKCVYFVRHRKPVSHGNISVIRGIYVPELNKMVCKVLQGSFVRDLFLAEGDYRDEIQAGLQGGNSTTKGQCGLTTDTYMDVTEFESDEAVVKNVVQDLEMVINLEEKTNLGISDLFETARSYVDN